MWAKSTSMKEERRTDLLELGQNGITRDGHVLLVPFPHTPVTFG